MLAAIISLLLVILFVLLLHVYAKWFLAQSRNRNNTTSSSSVSVSVPHVFGGPFHHFHSSFIIDTTLSDSPGKGLESAVVDLLPLFKYKADNDKCKNGLECVICLSLFEDEEMGRKLPKCGHVFHVECIDMWLHSHSTCPICRDNPVVVSDDKIEIEQRNGDLALEVIVEVPNMENENVMVNDSLSGCSSSSSLSSFLLTAAARSERKVHPSTNVVELDT